MPTFQDSIAEAFPSSQVQVIALNHDAPAIPPGASYWLQSYVNFVGNISVYYKSEPLTYPMIHDSAGAIFASYEAGTLTNPLPCLFLIDQTGKIRFRGNGKAEEGPFWDEFAALMSELRNLLNPSNP